MDYFEEAKAIWDRHVPRVGQSKTVEGEMLRAVEKLRDEAVRNGNGNWDEGFETLLAYTGASTDRPRRLHDPANQRNPDRLEAPAAG